MSDFWERVKGIKAQQSAMQTAKQDAAIAKATDFWNRVDSIKAQQSSGSGVYPSASEFIKNAGYDPAAVAFTESPFYPGKSSSPSLQISGGDLTKPRAVPSDGDHSGGAIITSPIAPSTFDYLNAEIAAHYGMSRETAYQEALSNTAYQRSLKDMKAAGLNPAVIFGAGKGSPADGVYSARADSPAVILGGSGGGYGGSSAKRSSKKNDKLFTSQQYYGISTAAGLATAVITGNPGNYYVGSTVAQNIMTTVNNIFKK